MDELVHEIFKKEEKGFVEHFGRLVPQKLKKLLYVLLVLSSFLGGYKSRPYIEQSIKLEKIGIIQTGLINLFFGDKVKGATDSIDDHKKPSCMYNYCSDFKDDKWIYRERFTIVQENPLILKSPNTSVLPGATLFFDQDVGNFTMIAFLTPLSSPSPNMVVAYGHFLRCIIGDGDYAKVSCQINTDYPKAIENWSYIDSQGNLNGKNLRYQISPFVKGDELQIKFSILKVNNNKQVEIKLNDQVPIFWLLPKEFEKRIQKEKVGVGLFTAGQDDVQAVFKEFLLDVHI